MKTFKISGIGNINNLTEVMVIDKIELEQISELLRKPILEAEEFSQRDKHNFKASLTHSFYAVLDGNVIYKYIFNIKKEEVEE